VLAENALAQAPKPDRIVNIADGGRQLKVILEMSAGDKTCGKQRVHLRPFFQRM
jgi:hypothetical protein